MLAGWLAGWLAGDSSRDAAAGELLMSPEQISSSFTFSFVFFRVTFFDCALSLLCALSCGLSLLRVASQVSQLTGLRRSPGNAALRKRGRGRRQAQPAVGPTRGYNDFDMIFDPLLFARFHQRRYDSRAGLRCLHHAALKKNKRTFGFVVSQKWGHQARRRNSSRQTSSNGTATSTSF